MVKHKSPHQAAFTHKEFKELCLEFPEKRNCLEEVSHEFGPNIIVKIEDLSDSTSKDRLGVALYDRLFYRGYAEASYARAKNFTSVWHQLNEIWRLPKSEVHSILEVGKGIGLFNSIIDSYDYDVTTLDIDDTYQPDLVGNILDMPVPENSYDLVCAFEVLQHVPSKKMGKALKEIVRVASRYVYISLPCRTSSVKFDIALEFRQRFLNRLSCNGRFFRSFGVGKLADNDEDEMLKRLDKHHPHYWEVGTRSFAKKSILKRLDDANLKVIKQFHNPEHAYHWFILCEVSHDKNSL